MVIPMPCKFGESADCKGIVRPLSGVSWFKWSWGMEYTYFFETGNKWRITDFYCTREMKQSFEMDIPDSLLVDKPTKEHGFPLRGTGYACGVDYKDGKTYIDFIMTSIYLSHEKHNAIKIGNMNGTDILSYRQAGIRKKRKTGL